MEKNYFLANVPLSAAVYSKDPIVPLAGVGINPMIANNAVLILHDGCQVSGW